MTWAVFNETTGQVEQRWETKKGADGAVKELNDGPEVLHRGEPCRWKSAKLLELVDESPVLEAESSDSKGG